VVFTDNTGEWRGLLTAEDSEIIPFLTEEWSWRRISCSLRRCQISSLTWPSAAVNETTVAVELVSPVGSGSLCSGSCGGCALAAKRPAAPWAALGGVLPAG